MCPKRYKTIYKKIHPPEADALADAYGDASKTVLQDVQEINIVLSELDGSWDGKQKEEFMDMVRKIPSKASEYAVSTLQGIEKGFRAIEVDVEEQVQVES